MARLSKSRVVAGAKCARLLWLRVHASDAPELAPTSHQLALFASGHRVGAAAQLCLTNDGRTSSVVTIDGPSAPGGLDRRVKETSAAIASGAGVIFEASFVHGGVFVAVDALVRCGDGSERRWVAVEVKGAGRVKKDHVLDVATQLWVLRGAGIDVARAEVMHLDSAFRTGGVSGSGGALPPVDAVDCAAFMRTNVTEVAVARLAGSGGGGRNDGDDEGDASIAALVEGLHGMLEGAIPSVCGAGRGAVSGCDCQLVVDGIAKREAAASSSSPSEPSSTVATSVRDELDDVRRLYRLGKRSARELAAEGIVRISDVPPTFKLPPIASRQRESFARSVVGVGSSSAEEPVDANWERGLWMDHDGVLEALGSAALPATFVDFEAIAPALSPARWPDCAPFQQLPVQASCHSLRADVGEEAAGVTLASARAAPRSETEATAGVAELTHAEWLAPSKCAGQDPRPELAEWLLEQCGDAASLVAYSASFEIKAIEQLAERASSATTSTELRRLKGKFVDLLPIVRKGVYHPRFNGSFSLKAVLPALLPVGVSGATPSYHDLAVASGFDAATQLDGLLLRGEPAGAGARATLRAQLLTYCATDTLALVALAQRLRDLALLRRNTANGREDGWG